MAEFGWTYLSRMALAKAEAQLSGESQGVRDEIGFLLIHQHYADRLFPGTSVLHTRLRYVLFVPWMYQALRESRVNLTPEQAVQKMEGDLCRRLLQFHSYQFGIIGRLSQGKSMGQPPSMVYWNALVTWGFVRREGGKVPNRHRMARLAVGGQSRMPYDLELVEEPELLPLNRLVPMHEEDRTGPLSFALRPPEKVYLCEKLRDLPCGGGTGDLSLLARLVRKIESSETAPACLKAVNCWDAPMLAVAKEERECLIRAGNAAAMAAIGRGVYAALVESLIAWDSGSAAGVLHRDALDRAVQLHRDRALELDVVRLAEEVRNVPAETLQVLSATQDWLRRRSADIAELKQAYTEAEWARKRERACLRMTPNGQKRRLDWKSENAGDDGRERTHAEPLHYRWNVVQRLMADLHGGSDAV